MNEKVELESVLVKLEENNFDLSELTPTELKYLQMYAPAIFEAAKKMGEMGSKAQEKVYSIIEKAIEIYHEQLSDPNLSEEGRDKLNDRIERMVEKAFEKDSELKKWVGTLVCVGVSGVALTLAGKNPGIRKAALNLLAKGKQS